jgi:hypothetical protein
MNRFDVVKYISGARTRGKFWENNGNNINRDAMSRQTCNGSCTVHFVTRFTAALCVYLTFIKRPFMYAKLVKL